MMFLTINHYISFKANIKGFEQKVIICVFQTSKLFKTTLRLFTKTPHEKKPYSEVVYPPRQFVILHINPSFQ
jgi:hypothetical protein